jgi:hypothetical protein
MHEAKRNGMPETPPPWLVTTEKQPDSVEIENNGCTCGECIPCKLRKYIRKAEEEALNSADSHE